MWAAEIWLRLVDVRWTHWLRHRYLSLVFLVAERLQYSVQSSEKDLLVLVEAEFYRSMYRLSSSITAGKVSRLIYAMLLTDVSAAACAHVQ